LIGVVSVISFNGVAPAIFSFIDFSLYIAQNNLISIALERGSGGE